MFCLPYNVTKNWAVKLSHYVTNSLDVWSRSLYISTGFPLFDVDSSISNIVGDIIVCVRHLLGSDGIDSLYQHRAVNHPCSQRANKQTSQTVSHSISSPPYAHTCGGNAQELVCGAPLGQWWGPWFRGRSSSRPRTLQSLRQGPQRVRPCQESGRRTQTCLALKVGARPRAATAQNVYGCWPLVGCHML